MMPANRSANDAIRSTAHIDDTVAEVFELMLQQSCAVVDQASPAATGIWAKIVFSGTLEGQCLVHVSTIAADRVADALLGAEGDWDDEMVDDAVGELCNMIAGGWKSRLDAPASVCQLSVPAVSRGLIPKAQHRTTPMTRRFYEFNGAVLEVVLELR